MAHLPAAADERSPATARRHEVDVERRRAHPGEPRRTAVVERPSPPHERRGTHAYARAR